MAEGWTPKDGKYMALDVAETANRAAALKGRQWTPEQSPYLQADVEETARRVAEMQGGGRKPAAGFQKPPIARRDPLRPDGAGHGIE